MKDESPQAPQLSLDLMRRVAADADLHTAARRYASVGIPVFPCVAGGKQPLTANGFKDASTDPHIVEEWWRRTPNANIGLPTGALSGLQVVDIDVRGTGSGYDAFDQVQRSGIGSGWGWLVRTPSGGLHAYYPSSGWGAERSWSLPRSHVDFRGDGGYVVVPPSRIQVDGAAASYAVIAVAQHEPQVLDAQELRRFLDPPGHLPHRRPAPAMGSRPDRLAAWVAEQPEGGRNQGLFWASCRMVENGHRYDTTLAILGEAARIAGLSDREAESTIRSAYRITSRLSTGSPVGPTREGVAL